MTKVKAGFKISTAWSWNPHWVSSQIYDVTAHDTAMTEPPKNSCD